MSVLVLLRHGESAWNAANVFTGWIDVGLSEHGERQAQQAGALLEVRPRGESLHDVMVRLLPYWYDAIVPDLCRYGCVVVVSHGNTLRGLIKHIEAVSDEATSGLEVPNAVPLCYEFRSRHVTRLAAAAGVSGSDVNKTPAPTDG